MEVRTTESYQICSRCVMDTTDLQITFNSEGHCNHCEEFITRRINFKYQGDESDAKFDDLITQIQIAGNGKKYDCILGLSGGVDSSFVAYALKSRGLRILAVHMDNGWNSEEAVSNIRNIANKLDIDYESFVLDYDEFKEIQLAFLKASVPEAETPTDMAIPAVMHKIASKYGVQFIISGGNMATEGILPASWHYNAKDTRYFKAILKKFGNKRIKSFPLFGFKQEAYFKVIRGIKMVYPLNFIDYDKESAQKILENELDWKYYGGKHRESKYTDFIQSYYLYTKFGIDYRRATLSTQICTGDRSRNDAIEELKTPPFNELHVKNQIKYISKKLGISESQLQEIVGLPPKYYWDYPNDAKKLGFIYDTYRWMYKKEKLASF